METIIINDIEIKIIRKNIKNIYLRVSSPEAAVHISAPKSISNEIIQNFVASKINWIHKRIELIKQRNEEKIVYHYVDDEIHFYKGMPYKLSIIENSLLQKVILEDNKIVINVPIGADEKKRCEILQRWYASELEKTLLVFVEKWQKRLNVTVNQIKIRKMKTLWGSCNFRSQRITFNLELCKRSLECIEYIVVHELAHLIEPSHNHKFKSILDSHLPDWRERKKELNKFFL